MYKQHVRGIIDELIKNSMKAKASRIDTSIELEGNEVKITVKDNGQGMNEESLEVVRKKLNQCRRYELEEYYGSLAGESSMGSGLSLVGMMTDSANVETEEGKGTTVEIVMRVRGD